MASWLSSISFLETDIVLFSSFLIEGGDGKSSKEALGI